MGGDKILRALIGKRLELLGELERHETAVAALQADLVHLDGSIRVFTHGLARTLLGVLRTAEKPLSTDELATRAEIAAKRAGWVLRYMAECGLVKAQRSPGKPALWHATY
jgi:chromosome segregation and condensation protein ScpB